MNALVPKLIVSLVSAAQVEAATLCQVKGKGGFPLDAVSLAWGEILPHGGPSHWFEEWRQAVSVVLSGPRYFQTHEAMALHETRSTRLGLQRTTTIQLGGQSQLRLWEYPDMIGAQKSRWNSAYLIQNEGLENQNIISLDCE